MEKKAYEQLYDVQDNYWYHHSLRKLSEIYLKKMRSEFGRPLKILDIGSGTGAMLGLLKKYGDVRCLEISDYAAELCRNKYPDIDLTIGSANRLSELFSGDSFDLVTFFNVLYHKWIEDDFEVLKQASGLIKQGGYIISAEPAFNCLYRDNDKFCHGVRRYSRIGITNMLSKAGFRMEKSTYFNSISFFPLLVSVLLQRLGTMKTKNESNELRPLHPLVNSCLNIAMSLERLVITVFGKIPFGVSILAIGKKGS